MMGRGTSLAMVVATLAFAGCNSSKTDDGEARVATWFGGIQPLMVEKCGACHTEGGPGPFALDTYADASFVAEQAIGAVEAGIMPPWGAQDTDECQPRLPWKDDLRLSDDDKALLRAWVDAGTPLGDEATALPVPSRPSLEIANPSVAMSFDNDFEIRPGQGDVFECFVLDPGVTEDVWISAVQVTAGNQAVAHHALVFLDPNAASVPLATDGHFPCFSNPDIDGMLIGAWTPGAVPFEIPYGAGIPMKPGAKIVVQMHYHPASDPQLDRSTVSLRYSTQRPQLEARLALLGNASSQETDGYGLQPGPNDRGAAEFQIPANVKNHTETMILSQTEVPVAVPIFAVGAHMHYVGVDMKIEHKPVATGQNECLLQTPSWDFNWQRAYTYDTPSIDDLPTVRPGDELILRCTYDNTMGNRFVADALAEQGLDAPVDVSLGEQTLDEMCLGVFGVLVPPGFLE